MQTLLCLLLTILPDGLYSQVLDTEMKVDTLSFSSRLSVRTNAVDWTLLVPNIGVEFDLGNKNWSRWTLGGTVRYNWQTKHTFNTGVVYNIRGGRLELRNYWRTRQVDSRRGVPPHGNIVDRLFSCRRNKVRHPLFTWYRGLYLSYNDFSIKLGSEGHQGKAMTFGLTYGFVKPLYSFKSGNSLDLDFGISAGLSYLKFNKYRYDSDADCYHITEVKDWHFRPIPTVSDVRVALVYRFGKTPVTSKYRWRYDCDARYRYLTDSIAADRTTKRLNKILSDSIYKAVKQEFDVIYDSVAAVNKAAAKEKKRLDKIKRQQEKKLKRQMKKREKAERDSLKQIRRKQKKAKAAESRKASQNLQAPEAAGLSAEPMPAAGVAPGSGSGERKEGGEQ